MTVSNTTRIAGPFSGNGSTTAFPFTFKVFQAADLRIVFTNSSGVESDLTIGSNPTVALNADQDANPGGTVTYTTLAVGQKLTIVGNIVQNQPLDITNGSGFYASVMEKAFDRVTIIAQEIRALFGRALTFPVSDSPALTKEFPPAATRANKALVFGADGSVGLSSSNFEDQAAAAAAFAAQAANSASNAASSATDADAFADSAQASAVAAGAFAGAAAASQADAAQKAIDAAGYAANSLASANAAAASFDSFDDRYLGAKASDPTLDNDGNALLTGALYWNTTQPWMRVWTGSAWVNVTNTTVRSGSGAPGAGLGSDGDFYINTAVYNIYGPKTAGAWGSPTSLVGPPGPGSGDVVGPSTAVDGEVALFNGTTGKLIKRSSLSAAVVKMVSGIQSAAAAAVDFVAPGLFTVSGLTMNTARLLGRTAAGVGAAEEISMGFGLSLTGGVLSAASAGSQLITANGTLGENHFIYAGDYAVTMPDLTTLKQFSLTLPSDLQAFTNNPLTPDGWTVNLNFSAGVTKTNPPLAFGSPHGWWGSLVMTPPVNGTSATVGAATLTFVASVALSATLHIYIVTEGTTPATYAIAGNPTTGAWGAPIQISATNQTNGWLYAASSTSFVFVGAGNQFAIAGSVSTLTITLGASQALSANPDDAPVQLTSTTYLLSLAAATNNLVVLSVSGTTLSLGTAVTGKTAATAGMRMHPISATAVLLAYATSAAASSTLTTRVASISGTTITLNTTAVSGTTAINGTANPFATLLAVNPGTVFIFCAQSSANANDGAWYGITVSGTTVTLGTVQTATNQRGNAYRRDTHVYRQNFNATLDETKAAVVNTTTGLFSISSSAALVAVSISGTTLTFGATFSTSTPQAILTDISTGAILYGVGASSYSRLSISGVTITATYTIASGPQVIFSDTLTDKAVNYGGVWYTWTGIPALFFPISVSKYANQSSNVLRSYGSFS